jgi:hypothetical protein
VLGRADQADHVALRIVRELSGFYAGPEGQPEVRPHLNCSVGWSHD